MKPHFLCIGAQKAGTTWLYANLKRHPEIWMPPIKELHFFDGATPPGLYRNLLSNMAGFSRPGASQDILFLLKLAILSRTVENYGKLFPDLDGRVTGDITPAYARLTDETIREIHRVLPQAKILYILRDPIERARSQVKMRMARLKCTATQVAGWSDDELRRRLLGGAAEENSAYVANLEKWGRYYGEANLAVLYFDDIRDEPEQFLLDVFRFVGVTPSTEYTAQSMTRRIHAGTRTTIPPRLEALIREMHIDQVRRVHAHLNNEKTRRWLDNASEATAAPA